MASPIELRAQLAQTLLELALCASAPARLLVPIRPSSRPTSQPPRDADDPTALYHERVAAAGDDAGTLQRLLTAAQRDVAHLRRRELPGVAVESREELDARIVDVGEGFALLDVAIACRTSEGIVRRARLRAGRDPEWGRRLALEQVNGRPLAFGLELVRVGYPLRVASALSGVAKSTLHEHLRGEP